MPVTFVDQLSFLLSAAPQCDAFLSDAAADDFCTRTFTRRFGLDGYTIGGVTLGATQLARVEVGVALTERWSGSRDRRGDSYERWAIEFRVSRASELAWIDCLANATANVTFSALALTGAAVGGPAITDPGPVNHLLGFMLPTSDGSSQTVTYPIDIYVFGSDDISPVNDLRRIGEARRVLDGDPAVIRSLNDPLSQRLSLYVQAYAANADPAPLTQATVSALFESADVLVAFSSGVPGDVA